MRSRKFLPSLREPFLHNGLRVPIILNHPIRNIVRAVEVRQEECFELGLLFSHAELIAWKTQSDRCPNPKRAFRLGRAAMQIHDRFYNREAETITG